MKRFVWRLQRVLDIKKKEEQKVRTELFELTQELAQVRGELLTRKKILEQIINSLAKENPGERLAKQELFLKYSATNDELIKKLKKKIGELHTQQREKIAEVLKIKRFKEGLESLREEAKMEFIKEQEKIEQKELDETSTVSYVRRA